MLDLNTIFTHIRDLEKEFEEAKDVQSVLNVYRHLEHVRRVWDDISNALKRSIQSSPDSTVEDRIVSDIDNFLITLGRMSDSVKDWRITRTKPEPAKPPSKKKPELNGTSKG